MKEFCGLKKKVQINFGEVEKVLTFAVPNEREGNRE